MEWGNGIVLIRGQFILKWASSCKLDDTQATLGTRNTYIETRLGGGIARALGKS